MNGLKPASECDRSTIMNLLTGGLQTPFEDVIEFQPSDGGGRAHFLFDHSRVYKKGPEVELRLGFRGGSIVGNTTVRTLLGGSDLTDQSGVLSLSLPTGRASVTFESPNPGAPATANMVQRIAAGILARTLAPTPVAYPAHSL